MGLGSVCGAGDGLARVAALFFAALSFCSITLIECGPVNTSFLSNMQSMDPEGHELQGLDPKTYALYCQYFQHCQSLFQDAAQDTDEVLQVTLGFLLLFCPGTWIGWDKGLELTLEPEAGRAL